MSPVEIIGGVRVNARDADRYRPRLAPHTMARPAPGDVPPPPPQDTVDATLRPVTVPVDPAPTDPVPDGALAVPDPDADALAAFAPVDDDDADGDSDPADADGGDQPDDVPDVPPVTAPRTRARRPTKK